MTIYEKNLQVLSAAYPNMDELIEKAKEDIKPELEIIEETSDDGDAVLRIKKDDKVCYLAGKRNAKEPARVWREVQGELVENAPVFMMGLGNPFYLKELAENTKNRIAIIIYEPSFQIFLKFLETVPLQRWMEKHLIVFWVEGIQGVNEDVMRNSIKSILRHQIIPYARRLILPNYDVLFPEQAVLFMQILRDIVNDEMVLYSTEMLFSTVAVRNLLDNVKYLCDGYKTTQLIKVIPRDIPGIVVAAGPSLNKNIMELKRAKGRAFIVAVDTAIKPLLEAKIIPDMFVIVDGKKPLDLIRKEEAKKIPLLSSICANSEILKYHTGMKFFYDEGYSIATNIMVQSDAAFGGVDTGGSVATNAFSLLYKIGLTRIILVGQDLAYTGNKSHADGTFADVMKEEDTKNYIMVEGNVEQEVPTTEVLKIYLDWYDAYITGIQGINPEFRVINATEGGAKIKNTEIMTLHDAIEKECTKEIDIQECLSQLTPMIKEKSLKSVLEYVESFPDMFSELAEDARKAKMMYSKLDKICNKRKLDSKEYKSILKKIEKVVKKIESNDMYQLVDNTMVNARYILLREQLFHMDTIQQEGKEIARQGILYTENVAKIAYLFKDYLNGREIEVAK